MADVPFADDKDWTWVLRTECTECRFDVRHFPREQISNLIRDNAVRWIPILELDDERLRRRPRPDRWSALEYAAHVRDVFELFDHRLDLMLTEDAPHFPNWNQDETALDKHYDEADPADVLEDLQANATRLAVRFAAVSGAQWERTGHRSDGASFTVESFARYLIHDPEHHRHDVEHGLRMIASEG